MHCNRWMETWLVIWLSTCRWNNMMMVREEDFVHVWVCLEKVYNARTRIRSCAGLQESMVIYGAEMASARCLEMEPLTFRPTYCKIMLPPTTHAHTHTYTDVETQWHTHTVSPPLPSVFHSSFFSEEFKSKMNLSVTELLQLQEKHTFQHMESVREGRVERSRSCWDSQRRRRTGSKGGAVVQEFEKLLWLNVRAC